MHRLSAAGVSLPGAKTFSHCKSSAEAHRLRNRQLRARFFLASAWRQPTLVIYTYDFIATTKDKLPGARWIAVDGVQGNFSPEPLQRFPKACTSKSSLLFGIFWEVCLQPDP